MNASSNSESSSLLPTALLITFVVLKLTGVIAWSWWWVLAPFWVPLAVAAALFGIYVAVVAVRR